MFLKRYKAPFVFPTICRSRKGLLSLDHSCACSMLEGFLVGFGSLALPQAC